ncbi:9022_t:CDS:1, partial [Scutellospora calospora]
MFSFLNKKTSKTSRKIIKISNVNNCKKRKRDVVDDAIEKMTKR